MFVWGMPGRKWYLATRSPIVHWLTLLYLLWFHCIFLPTTNNISFIHFVHFAPSFNNFIYYVFIIILSGKRQLTDSVQCVDSLLCVYNRNNKSDSSFTWRHSEYYVGSTKGAHANCTICVPWVRISEYAANAGWQILLSRWHTCPTIMYL